MMDVVGVEAGIIWSLLWSANAFKRLICGSALISPPRRKAAPGCCVRIWAMSSFRKLNCASTISLPSRGAVNEACRMLGCSGLASRNEQVLLSVVGCQALALLAQTGHKLKE
jgi:hypothetical protein